MPTTSRSPKERDPILSSQYLPFVTGLQIFAGLYVIAQFNFLLFHSFAEGFSIIIALGVFMVATQARASAEAAYFTFTGTACLFVALLEMLHTLGFTGLNIIRGYGSDLPLQLWTATRLLQAGSLLAGLFFLGRKLRLGQVFFPYLLLTGLVLLGIFSWDLFPACLDATNRPTAFTRGANWLIAGTLAAAGLLLAIKRDEFDEDSFRSLLLALATLLLSEILFLWEARLTAPGFYTVCAHFFRILSFYLFYRAASASCLEKPFEAVLRDLRQKEKTLTEAQFLAGLGNYEQNLSSGEWSWSAGLYHLFGSEAGELAPTTEQFWAMVHPADREAARKNFAKLLARRRPIELAFRLVTRDGETRDIQVIGAGVYDRDGKAVSHYGTMQDVTERRKSQEALRKAYGEMEQRVVERTRELQQAHEQLLHAGKLSAIGKLSASIAHEFNNPLYGVVNVITGIRRRAHLEPADAELLDMAIAECGRMKNLIRDLQDFNRPSSGQMAMMDLHKTIDSLLLLSKKEHSNRRIEIVRAYDRRLPGIRAVADQIKQVLLNLLNNAADACEEGGTITIATELLAGGQVAIRVSDTGKGIKPEDLPHIFEPFFTTKPAVKGTGLGLSISYGIIKSHGGIIRVESEPGRGTTFTVTLPVEGVLDEEKKDTAG